MPADAASPALVRTMRWGGVAAVVYAAGMLAVGAVEALVTGLTVPDAAELLRDVRANRAAWVAAECALGALQAALVPFVVALWWWVGRRAAAATAFFAVGSILLVTSAVFHGVLGVHLASPNAVDPDGRGLVRDVDVVHALGDTSYFAASVGVGIGMLALAPVSPPAMARVAVAAAVFGALQFAWFVDAAGGWFAPLAAGLQALWFVLAGVSLWGSAAPAAERTAPGAAGASGTA